MKSPTTTLTATLAAMATLTVMVLACSSPDSAETTEQQTTAAQPIATIQVQSEPPSQNNDPTTPTQKPTTAAVQTTGSPGQTNDQRPSFATPTALAPPPVATPTRGATMSQEGGIVVRQGPTPTPKPPPTPTNTPVPPEVPYWRQFSQADYDQFLTPAGPIAWRPSDVEIKCRGTTRRVIIDTTPQGILDRIEWEYKAHPGGGIGAVMKHIGDEDPSLFGPNPLNRSGVERVCGTIEALHPRIPVVRTTFSLNFRTRETWEDQNGRHHPVYEAYRVEMRYIEAHEGNRLNYKPLGPVIIEHLGTPCDRPELDLHAHDQRCARPPN